MRSGTMQHGFFFGDDLFGATDKQWGWIMALGILFVVLGTVGLGAVFMLTLASI